MAIGKHRCWGSSPAFESKRPWDISWQVDDIFPINRLLVNVLICVRVMLDAQCGKGDHYDSPHVQYTAGAGTCGFASIASEGCGKPRCSNGTGILHDEYGSAWCACNLGGRHSQCTSPYFSCSTEAIRYHGCSSENTRTVRSMVSTPPFSLSSSPCMSPTTSIFDLGTEQGR